MSLRSLFYESGVLISHMFQFDSRVVFWLMERWLFVLVGIVALAKSGGTFWVVHVGHGDVHRVQIDFISALSCLVNATAPACSW